MLKELTKEKRENIYVILFIAHTNPSTHSAFSEKWLENVVDRVLTYALSYEQFKHIKKLKKNQESFREKAVFDYTYLLKACSAVDASYILMNENDVIALESRRLISQITESA